MFGICGSSSRTPGERTAFEHFSAIRAIKVARSKLVERTGVQEFHLVTLQSASADQTVVRGRALNGFGGFTLSGSGQQAD